MKLNKNQLYSQQPYIRNSNNDQLSLYPQHLKHLITEQTHASTHLPSIVTPCMPMLPIVLCCHQMFQSKNFYSLCILLTALHLFQLLSVLYVFQTKIILRKDNSLNYFLQPKLSKLFLKKIFFSAKYLCYCDYV